jgi:hypothetical protein
MHVRMLVQVLPPGVQHQQHADLSAQPLGVGSHISQRVGRRLERVCTEWIDAGLEPQATAG